jgi:hypothetical protein
VSGVSAAGGPRPSAFANALRRTRRARRLAQGGRIKKSPPSERSGHLCGRATFRRREAAGRLWTCAGGVLTRVRWEAFSERRTGLPLPAFLRVLRALRGKTLESSEQKAAKEAKGERTQTSSRRNRYRFRSEDHRAGAYDAHAAQKVARDLRARAESGYWPVTLPATGPSRATQHVNSSALMTSGTGRIPSCQFFSRRNRHRFRSEDLRDRVASTPEVLLWVGHALYPTYVILTEPSPVPLRRPPARGRAGSRRRTLNRRQRRKRRGNRRERFPDGTVTGSAPETRGQVHTICMPAPGVSAVAYSRRRKVAGHQDGTVTGSAPKRSSPRPSGRLS